MKKYDIKDLTWNISQAFGKWNWYPTNKLHEPAKDLVESHCGMSISFYISNAVELLEFQDKTHLHDEYSTTFDDLCSMKGFRAPQFRYTIEEDKILVQGEYMFEMKDRPKGTRDVVHINNWQQFYTWFRVYLNK